MVMSEKEFVAQGAHTSLITSLEYCKFNGQEIIFTGSTDKTLKAWVIDRAQGVLTAMHTQPFDCGVNTLKMTSETFLIIGLQNGTFQGWNLEKNSFDTLPAHTQSVTALHKHANFLVSGDATGEIKVWDVSNFSTVL